MRKTKVYKMLMTNYVANKKEVTKTVTSNGINIQEANHQKLEVTYLC